ncbi:MAG: PfkB family carbohydrate kinase [Albidovulum sp.]|nr:PfkB family carbohydrate kinase [Albidovulum sp.]
MKTILIAGQSVVDLMFEVSELPAMPVKYRASDMLLSIGGCAMVAAVAVARLGGNPVLASRIGDDFFGDLIKDELEREGIDTSYLARIKGAETSVSSVCTDTDGERQIVNFRGANLGDLVDLPAIDFDAVLVDSRWEEGASRALGIAAERGLPGIVDAEQPTPPRIAQLASHVAFSAQGLLHFSGESDLDEALVSASKRLPGWVSVTDGENGTYTMNGNSVERTPAFDIDAVDTTGAGDVWHGAFALRLAETGCELEAVSFANAAGALKCLEKGIPKGTPSRREVEEFLSANR